MEVKSMREWLFDIRKNKNFTMAEVADKSGISESYYSMIESGARGVSVSTAKSISKVLQFNWTRFYEDKDEKHTI